MNRVLEPPPRSRGWGAAAVAGIAAIAAIALSWTRSPPEPVKGPEPPASAPTAVPMTELPDPPTSSREALAAYRSAVQALHDGVSGAGARFQRAVELDPNLAAGHLRLAYLRFQLAPGEGRAAYNRAEELRSALSPRDQALLWAFEPFIAERSLDMPEHARRLRELTLRYPLDAEIYYQLGLSAIGRFVFYDLAALGKAVEIDPTFARAWWQLGQGHAYRGELPEARAALDKCIQVSHAATNCLWNRMCLNESDGRCAEVETDATTWAAVDGKDPLGRLAVASALYARGRSIEAVREALRQKESVEPDSERPRSVLYDEMQLAFLRGDFVEALRDAREIDALTATAQAETEHQLSARAILEALTESGRLPEAAAYAAQYLKRREAWLPEPFAEDFAIANDVTPLLLRTLRVAKALSPDDFRKQRDAFVASWQARFTPDAFGYVWMHGRAAVVESPADADEALGAFPGLVIPAYTPKTLATVSVGKTYLLAGRVDEAIAVLARTAGSCLALELPVAHTHASLWLGKAREAKHDTAGACQAYGLVLSRWGKAVPRSISADEARARSKALGCK
jgi:eukaryotic-like serine/threonine-protein kinase